MQSVHGAVSMHAVGACLAAAVLIMAARLPSPAVHQQAAACMYVGYSHSLGSGLQQNLCPSLFHLPSM